MKTLALIVLASLMTSAVVSAQTVFNNFEGATNGSTYGFRFPSFSGSTDSNLNGFGGTITPNLQIATSTFPPGLPAAGTRVGKAQFQFLDNSLLRWLRHTTFNAAGSPNPVLDITQPLQFEIWTDVPLRASIFVRESVSAVGPIGSDGGVVGPIEAVGATSYRAPGTDATAAPVGVLLAVGSWQTITIDFATAPVLPFSAGTNGVNPNGVLDPPNGSFVTLESIALTSEGAPGPYTVYYDNFRQIPEPVTGAMGASFVLALVASRRGRLRRRRVRQ